MAGKDVVRNLRDGTLKIADASGTGGGNVITVALEDGDLRWRETVNHDFILDRAVLDHARLAIDTPLEGSFTLKFTTFLDPNSATITPYEAMTQQGSASGWTSDQTQGGDGYAVILEFTINDPSGGTDEVVTFAEVYVEVLEHAEGAPNSSLSATFRMLGTRAAYA